MPPEIELSASLAPPLPLRKFSVEQYHQLGELGLLTPEDNVELLEGWIVEKMNQRPIHGFIVRILNEIFVRELPSGWLCQCQLPISTERSEPEPDLAIVRGTQIDYRAKHPSGSDCYLVIEVSDTSLDKDVAKADVYFSAGVREYWILNVAEKILQRYTMQPGGQEYVLEKIVDTVSLTVGDQSLTIELAQLFDE